MKNTLFDYIEQIENVGETFASMMKIFKLSTVVVCAEKYRTRENDFD